MDLEELKTLIKDVYPKCFEDYRKCDTPEGACFEGKNINILKKIIKKKYRKRIKNHLTF